MICNPFKTAYCLSLRRSTGADSEICASNSEYYVPLEKKIKPTINYHLLTTTGLCLVTESTKDPYQRLSQTFESPSPPACVDQLANAFPSMDRTKESRFRTVATFRSALSAQHWIVTGLVSPQCPAKYLVWSTMRSSLGVAPSNLFKASLSKGSVSLCINISELGDHCHSEFKSSQLVHGF